MMHSIVGLRQHKQLPALKPEIRTVARPPEPLLLERDELLMLYHAMAMQLEPDSPRVLEIISATHGEGTSTIARELARAIASEIRQPVLLIVATSSVALRRGLEAVANGEMPFDVAIEADADVPLLYRTTLNLSGTNTGLLFGRSELDQVLAQALRHVKLVIIDAPPALSEVAGIALARRAAGVLLVVEAERTRAAIVEQARRSLDAGGGRVLGVAMNKRMTHIPHAVSRRL